MKKKQIAGEILPLSKHFSGENSQGQEKKSSTEKTSKGLLQRKKKECISDKLYFTRLSPKRRKQFCAVNEKPPILKAFLLNFFPFFSLISVLPKFLNTDLQSE